MFKTGLLLCFLIIGAVPVLALETAPAAMDLSDEECAAFGQQLAGYIRAKDAATLVHHLDPFPLFDRMVAGIPLSDSDASTLRAEILEVLNKNLQQQFALFKEARFLRVQSVDHEKRALIRCIMTTGAVNYFAFTCARRASGGHKWIDVFTYINSELISQSMRRVLLPLIAESKKDLLSRLTAGESSYLKQLPKMQVAVKSLQDGHPKEALLALQALSPELQHERFVLVLKLRAAQSVDNAEYLKVIQEWEKAYPDDPALLMVSIDGDVLRKDYPAAIARIRALEKNLGGDAYQTYLAALIYKQAGEPAEARKCAREALVQEPSLSRCYDLLLGLGLEAKDYGEVVTVLKDFEIKHPHADMATALLNEPSYADFRKSPDYAQWLKDRETARGATNTQ